MLHYALFAFALVSCLTVNLATDTHSLPRFSKRTPRHCKPDYVQLPFDSFLDPAPFTPRLTNTVVVSDSFNPACAVLFSFMSPYYCTIGLWLCLGFGVNSPCSRFVFRKRYSGDSESSTRLSLRDFHLFMCGIPADFESTRSEVPESTTPHPPQLVAAEFGLPFAPFTRRYLGHRNSFSSCAY